MDALIELRDVTKVYKEGAGQTALDGVSLKLDEGEFAAIMGPSGSGKSTLLNLVAGLDRATSGSVCVAGQKLDRMSEAELARFRREKLGFVFQFFHLLPSLTVLENILIPAQLAGRRTPEKRARELLERLGLVEVAGRHPGRLSGGQQQRIAIARALVNEPRILLADEPTGALDTRSGEQVMELIQGLNREGQTVLLVTHDPKLATRYSSRVVSLMDGRVVDDVALHEGDRRAADLFSVRTEGAAS